MTPELEKAIEQALVLYAAHLKHAARRRILPMKKEPFVRKVLEYRDLGPDAPEDQTIVQFRTEYFGEFRYGETVPALLNLRTGETYIDTTRR